MYDHRITSMTNIGLLGLRVFMYGSLLAYHSLAISMRSMFIFSGDEYQCLDNHEIETDIFEDQLDLD